MFYSFARLAGARNSHELPEAGTGLGIRTRDPVMWPVLRQESRPAITVQERIAALEHGKKESCRVEGRFRIVSLEYLWI